MQSPDVRPVVIWRNALLAGSETFVRNQFDTLRVERVLAGVSRLQSPNSRDSDVVLFGESRGERIRRRWFLWTGRSHRVRAYIRSVCPRLIHVHFATDAWAVMHVARRLGIPVIVTAHGFDVTKWPRQAGLKGVVARRRLRAVLTRAARVVAVSRPIADAAVAWGAPEDNIVVHHMGVRLHPGRANVAPRWDVGLVGRLVEKKGLVDLVEAIGRFPTESRPTAIVMGDGPELAPAMARAIRLGVHIDFTGPLPPEEVASRIQEIRLLAVPSQVARDGDSEGLPTVILEASRAGVPVVGYRHSGIPEAVLEGVTGTLVEERDVAGLARAIGELLGNESMRREFGKRARDYVEKEFDMERQTAILESIYAVAAPASGPVCPD